MNFKAWIHSVAAAAIGAVSAAITTTIASPSTFNLSGAGLEHLGAVCGVSALLAVAAVLKQSPLPPDSAPGLPSGVGSAAIVALLCATLVMTGCTPQEQQTVVSLTTALSTAVVSLENIEGNPALAAKLQTDFAAVISAEGNWKSGTPAQDVIEALGIIQADLNLLPVSTQDQELVDLGIGLVDQILALLPAPATVVTPTGATLSNAVYLTGSAQPKLRHPKLVKPIKDAKDFKKRWNAIVKKQSKLAGAKLK